MDLVSAIIATIQGVPYNDGAYLTEGHELYTIGEELVLRVEDGCLCTYYDFEIITGSPKLGALTLVPDVGTILRTPIKVVIETISIWT